MSSEKERHDEPFSHFRVKEEVAIVNKRLHEIYFVFPFAQIEKEKLHNSIFTTFKKRD